MTLSISFHRSNGTPNATATSAEQVDRPTASILNFMDGGWMDVVADNKQSPQAQGMATRNRATENFEPADQGQSQGMATRNRATENFEPVFNFDVNPVSCEVVPINRQRVELSEQEKVVLRRVFLLRGVPRRHFGPHDFELAAFSRCRRRRC